MMDVDFELMNYDCCVSELFPNWLHAFKSFSVYHQELCVSFFFFGMKVIY